MQMEKILGLDLGSSSIGWTIRDKYNNFKSGVVTFDTGMVKGTGGYTSPTKDRREARSRRRLLQARKYRKQELLNILIQKGYVPLTITELELWSKYKKNQTRKFPESELFNKWLACDFRYQGGINYRNPYELRCKALDEKVSKHEFGRALYHLVQRRGYKNIGESDIEEVNIEEAKDTETKKQLERREVEGFATALQNNRTIAEALKKEFLDRGKRARNQYPLRKEYRQELELLCKAQGFDISRNDQGIYKDEFVQKLWKAIIWQRPLRSQKGNIGRCTLEKDRPRCPSSHPLFEIFRAWQFINTIKFSQEEDKEKDFLPNEIRRKLFNELFLTKYKNIKFSDIKKFLDKALESKNSYNYKDDHSVATMPICAGLVSIFGESIKEQIYELHKYIIGGSHNKDDHSRKAPKVVNGKYSVLDLWHALYSFDEIYLKYFAVQKLRIPNETTKNGRVINRFVELKKYISSSFSDLSVKAISKIIPFLQEGYLYNEAVLLAKMPELLNGEWEAKKENICRVVKEANEFYRWKKNIIAITNSLIDQWKAEPLNKQTISENNTEEITEACKYHFGEQSWNKKISTEQNNIVKAVKQSFEEFRKDSTHAYRTTPTLTEILTTELKNLNIHLNGELYHHSKQENKYLKKLGTDDNGEPKLPVDKKSGKKLLPLPLIDSIKNPMFNKALSVLRKLLNELILSDAIDEKTEVVVELARELNDNNKRIAIERYQREREQKREAYRKLLEEFKEKENLDFSIDENLSKVELWSEQIFEEDKKGIERLKRETILKEKDAIKRYELWAEQKGQCIYTGNMISLTQLFSNEIDIEHTIPRSLLPDNTLTNQTVCYAWYNRDKKKNQFPTQCNNYRKDEEGWGTAIEPRLRHWMELKEHYEKLYQDKLKPKGNEDEATKNKRIQDKHYYKMHLDYWTDKIERFTCEEIKESWVRRQLTDTQMISKYAREYLNTYFRKVKVQKGSVTADFRKIFRFQQEDELKNRNKHTHHAVDAAVLTLIPTNSSYRERLLKTMYEWEEQNRGQFTIKPFEKFNSQALIKNIENNILVVNYQKDKILQKTYKTVRKRGRIVYVRDKSGNYILDNNGNRIIKKAQGNSIRTTLYKETFVAKLKDVERDELGRPLKDENGKWKLKQGREEYFYAVRVPIDEAKKYIDDIVDPVIKELVEKQKNNPIVKDYQGNPIRHVRIRTTAGKEIKQRINYVSDNPYKNYYYAASGALPYAALLQKVNNGEIERILIPISAAEIGKLYKKHQQFNVEKYIDENYPEYKGYPDKQLLKVGQKVFVLNDDTDFEKRYDKDFQIKRLYIITQFDYLGRKIILKYHLESRERGDIDKSIKEIKSNIIQPLERELGLPEIRKDENIDNIVDRNKDYEKRLYDFDTRLKQIKQLDPVKAEKLKNQIEQYKTESSTCNDNNPVPILGLSQKNWNFLLEGEDFEISLSGNLVWKS